MLALESNILYAAFGWDPLGLAGYWYEYSQPEKL